MAKKKQQVPKEETKAQRFRRVVEPRVGKALKAISLVGNVRGSSYEYDDGQLATIEAALNDAVSKTMRQFAGTTDSTGGFSL